MTSCLKCKWCYKPTEICMKHNKSVSRLSGAKICEDFYSQEQFEEDFAKLNREFGCYKVFKKCEVQSHG